MGQIKSWWSSLKPCLAASFHSDSGSHSETTAASQALHKVSHSFLIGTYKLHIPLREVPLMVLQYLITSR